MKKEKNTANIVLTWISHNAFGSQTQKMHLAWPGEKQRKNWVDKQQHCDIVSQTPPLWG